MTDNPFAYVDYDNNELPDFETPTPVNSVQSITSNTALSKKAKLEQLKAREAELLKKQDQLKLQTAEVTLAPNWPPLYPIIRYNIENDLVPSARPTIINSYYGLIAIALSCVFNVLAVICISGLTNYNKTSCLIFALIQGIATAYVAINFSYTGIYESCKKKDVPFRWTVIQFCFTGWCCYRAVGFPNTGSVGFAVLLDLLAANKARFISKLFAFINSALSCAAVYFQFRTMLEAQKYQKISGRVDEDALKPQDTL